MRRLLISLALVAATVMSGRCQLSLFFESNKAISLPNDTVCLFLKAHACPDSLGQFLAKLDFDTAHWSLLSWKNELPAADFDFTENTTADAFVIYWSSAAGRPLAEGQPMLSFCVRAKKCTAALSPMVGFGSLPRFVGFVKNGNLEAAALDCSPFSMPISALAAPLGVVHLCKKDSVLADLSCAGCLVVWSDGSHDSIRFFKKQAFLA